MPRPLFALVMIVRDEATNIATTIASVRGVVDSVCILDTGSADGTQAVIAEAIKDIDGHLFEEPFIPFEGLPGRNIIDYAATRNRALHLHWRAFRETSAAQPAEPFTLMMSGDEVLVGGEALRAFLEAHRDATDDAYCITMRGGNSEWPYPRILRTGAGRRYVNPIHEVPVGAKGETGGPLIPGVRILFKQSDPARFAKRMREVDLPLLTHIAAQPVKTHEEHAQRARAIMCLGQTHEHLALEHKRDDPAGEWLTHQMTAMSFYWRRAELEGEEEERHYALFHYFNIAETIGLFSDKELVSRLAPLAEMDPRRPEIRYMLASHTGVLDARKGHALAVEAAHVAHMAKEKPLLMPTDARCEWLSYRLAAKCAVEMKEPRRAKAMAEKCIEAGGPREAVQEFLG